jgi:hypothetical protein
MDNKVVEFSGSRCLVIKGEYGNKRQSIRLIDEATGEPVAMVTINAPDHDLSHDEVIVKDYSENRGVLTVLVKAGILTPTGRLVATGYEFSQVCKVNV